MKPFMTGNAFCHLTVVEASTKQNNVSLLIIIFFFYIGLMLDGKFVYSYIQFLSGNGEDCLSFHSVLKSVLTDWAKA